MPGSKRSSVGCMLCVVACFGVAGGSLEAAGAEGAATGAITGRISFAGTVPPAKAMKLTADPKCAAMHPAGLERQAIRVKDGGVADVLVYVKSGLAGTYTPPGDPTLLDQIGCDYTPRMVVAMAGQPIQIRNSDDTLHNIHPRPTINKEFNIGQPRKGMVSTKTFDKPELMIPTGCDVHPWMRAYISVLPHPFYAVTGNDGRFEIKGLPDGEYEIEAVHGELKQIAGKASVRGGAPAKLELAYR
jgi:hypothetical protein